MKMTETFVEIVFIFERKERKVREMPGRFWCSGFVPPGWGPSRPEFDSQSFHPVL